ncbi:MAG TPA: beta-ketoacyl synthase chain length factor [Burkholderiales bacterium]|nr:beta-ketoacyl synthase chain length factor [Burkholderiales bacterium]
MRIFVEGVGLLGPGLHGWQASRAVLMGDEPYVHAPTIVTASDLLPPAERRRTGVPVKLALAVGREAFLNAERDASATPTVFTSSGGDSDNVHQICETLATPEREVSPTRFHNSVHNAAAGYWSIAAQSRESSTSLCCHDASFAAGLLEAATEIVVDGQPVALIAYDQPYPEPLQAVRMIGANFAVALVLTPHVSDRTFAALDVTFVTETANPTLMADSALESVRSTIPAARSLPLLRVLACGATEELIIEYLPGNHLRVVVTPC